MARSDAAAELRIIDPMMVALANSFTGTGTLEGLTRPLLELLETVTGLDSTFLTMVDEDTGLQHILFSRNTRQLQIPEGLTVAWSDTLCRRAIEEGIPYTDDVAGHWGDSDAARVLGVTTYASTPVHTGDGELYGTLCAASAAKVPMPPNADKVLALFAKLIGQHVELEALVAQLREANAKLASQALIDPLTNLPNRRALQMELDRMLARREREGQRLLVAFIDLDDFKAINDSYGHAAGDALLRAIGQSLASDLRAGDLAARYGGDEFVVVAPLSAGEAYGEVPLAALQHLLEQRTTVDFTFGTEGSVHYPGASVGVIRTEIGERDAAAILKRADTAMYAVKQQRRGRASSHTG